MADERITQGPRQTAVTYRIETMWAPTSGFTKFGETFGAAPESIVSGQNVWPLDGGIGPRHRLLSRAFTNAPCIAGASDLTSTASTSYRSYVLGAFIHTSVAGTSYPVLGTTNTFYAGSLASTGALQTSKLSFSQLSYVPSGGSNIPPALTNTEDWFGATAYSASRDSNIAVWVGMSGPQAGFPSSRTTSATYCWTAPALTFSHLTGAPGARDVVVLDNRVLLWNCSTNSSQLTGATSGTTGGVFWFEGGSYNATGGSSAAYDAITTWSLMTATLYFWETPPTSVTTTWGTYHSSLTLQSVLSSGYTTWVADSSVTQYSSSSGTVTRWSATSAAGATLTSLSTHGSAITVLSTNSGVVATWTDDYRMLAHWAADYPEFFSVTTAASAFTTSLPATSIPTRVQWCVGGDPEDWTGIGSGFEDLVDMQGVGTRAFIQGDQAFFATDHEIWRGRKIGPPYYFQFSPLLRTLGIPYPRAAIQTPWGFAWLGSDYRMHILVGESLEELAPTAQKWLRTILAFPQTAFFTFNDELNQLRLWFSDDNPGTTSTAEVFPTRSITIDMPSGAWYLDTYSLSFQRGLSDTRRIVNVDDGYATNLPTEMMFTSKSTGVQFEAFDGTDLNSAVTHEVIFGPLHSSDMRHLKTLREIRFDAGKVGAGSVFSVSVSVTGGSTYSETKQIVQAAQVEPQQSYTTVDTTGRYHTLRVRSISDEAGAWRIARIYTEAEGHSRER